MNYQVLKGMSLKQGGFIIVWSQDYCDLRSGQLYDP